MKIEKRFFRFLIPLILFLFCFGLETSWADAASKYRFYDSYRRLAAEKELDWRIRNNRAENLRLEFGATRSEFEPRREDYIDYLNRTERNYKELLRKEEKILNAPYLSSEDRRSISKGYESRIREVTDYYDKLRMNYYDYLRKSALIRMVSFPVQIGITLVTAGQALPVLLPLQTAKFAYDEYAFSKCPLGGTLTQRIIDKLYGFGMCFHSAFGMYEHAHILSTGKNLSGEVVCNTTFPTLARLEYFRAGYTASTPFVETISEYCPNSFLAKASPYLSMANSAISIVMEMSKPYQFAKEFGNSPSDGAKYFNRFTPSIYSLTSNTLNIAQNLGKVAGGERWSGSSTAFWFSQGASLRAAIADAHIRHYKSNNVEYTKQRADIYKDNFEYRPEVMKNSEFTDVCKKEMKALEKIEMNSRAFSETEKIIERENLWGSKYYKVLTPVEVLGREKVPIEQRDFSMQAPCISPDPADVYSGLLGIEGEKSATAWIYYKRGEETLPYASFDIDGEKLNCFVPYNIDYLATRYQDVHLENKGKFNIKAYFPEELKGTESKPHIYYGYDEKDTFIVDMQDKRYNRDWMTGGDSGVSYASFGQDRSLLLGSGGAMTAINTRLNSNNKYDYFIQISKNYSLTQSGDFRVFTDGKVYENPLVKELNQPKEQFFESFGNPYLWRHSEVSLTERYGASYGDRERELLSQITFEATPQNLASRYDPWLQHYSLRNQGVEQIQDASGKAVTYNRTQQSVEMLPVLGGKRTIGAGEFWKVEPGQGIIGNLATGEVREYRLSGRGGELTLKENPSPVEVYTGEWQSEAKRGFEGNIFEAREGFRRSIVNMNSHLNEGMANLEKGLEKRDKSWITQSESSFGKLGNDRNGAITQAKTEWKILDISQVVIGTREHPKIDLSFYRDSEGKVIGYSYLPREKELQDSRNLIDKKVELLPREGEIERLKEGSEGYGRIIDKSGKDLMSFVCGLPQTRAMENVLEGSQQVHSRLVNLTRVEQNIVLPSSDYSLSRSELISETVKFIAKENRLSLFLLIPIFSRSSLEVNYSLKIVLGKDKFEFVDYPVKWGFHWEVAKSFESAPKAKDKFTLKLDPIDKRASQSWGGQWARFTFDGTRSSLTFPLYEGYFLSGRLDLTASYGHAKKTEFLEATFLEISHADTVRVNEKFICDMALAYLLAHGILAVPYATPSPVTAGAIFILPQQLISSPENLQQE